MRIATAGVIAAVIFAGGQALAQQQPLPPLPPQQPQGQPQPAPPGNYPPPPQQGYPPPPPQGYPPPPPQGYPPPQQGYGQPQPYYQQQQPPPPPFEYQEPPVPKHAPKFSMWVGGRLGFLGFGGNFYDNNGSASSPPSGETTGNFVRNGLSLGLDIGVRLGKRYLPYVFLEHGFMGQGHRFEGTGATASTDLYGIGFRYTAGDVDTAGFLTDLSIGIRKVTVKNGSDTYTMQSLEIFRLGLGAEIRISTLFVLSPMATLSGGAMSDTDGHVTFSSDGSKDGVTTPAYQDGKQIQAQRGYVVVGIHCGAHFDVFGK